MSFLELAKARYSVRKYERRVVEDSKVQTILEAGRVAPTAANKQPNKFLLLNDQVAMEKLAKACSPHGAPMAIVICADQNKVWTRPFDQQNMVYVDATIACDHMMLCAQDLGLASCWITYFEPAILRAEFKIPSNLVPVNVLAIGYSAENPQSPERHIKTRKALNDYVQLASF